MIEYTTIRDPLPKVEIPEELRRKIAAHMDEIIMKAAMPTYGNPPPPTTLYVDKYGRYSTINPNAPQHSYWRNTAPFGLIVSS